MIRPCLTRWTVQNTVRRWLGLPVSREEADAALAKWKRDLATARHDVATDDLNRSLEALATELRR